MAKIDGFFSSTRCLDNGVPQGLPLSVVLYTIYTNFLTKALTTLSDIDYVGIYADNIFAICLGEPDVVAHNLKCMDQIIAI